MLSNNSGEDRRFERGPKCISSWKQTCLTQIVSQETYLLFLSLVFLVLENLYHWREDRKNYNCFSYNPEEVPYCPHFFQKREIVTKVFVKDSQRLCDERASINTSHFVQNCRKVAANVAEDCYSSVVRRYGEEDWGVCFCYGL